ncbi:MAG: hypothetical protein AAFQ84_02265 [Pseudomonadota bacterium]
MSIYDIIGLFGVAGVLGAFFLLQVERIAPRGYPYLLMNGFGAFGILISLIADFNLAAFVIESVWVAISVYGLVTLRQKRRTAKADSATAPADTP